MVSDSEITLESKIGDLNLSSAATGSLWRNERYSWISSV